MAKVKIQGHASGSGVFTITAPNSNTDRTITLPDASVTLGTDATKLPLAGGAMTGAITTNSTFDGVDVAAASVLASAALPKGGGTMSGEIVLNSTNLTCGDSTSNANKIRMGASDDLNIHHDGSNSYIEDSGTGALRILGSSIELRNAPSDNELMLKATVDGSVELYHNNVKKIETTATGVTVTGGVAIGGTGTANTIDDYEEGTWTPAIKFGGNAASFATSLNVGFYIKIGHFVHWSFRTTITNKGSSSGNCSITGLPFSCLGTTGNFGGGHIIFSQNWTADAGMSEEHNQCVIDSGSSSVMLRRIATNGGFNSTTNTQFTNSTQIIMKGEYRVS